MPFQKGNKIGLGRRFKRTTPVWNQGLTKKTSEKLRIIAEKESKTKKVNIIPQKLNLKKVIKILMDF